MAALQRLAVLQAAQRRIVAHRFDELPMGKPQVLSARLGGNPVEQPGNITVHNEQLALREVF